MTEVVTDAKIAGVLRLEGERFTVSLVVAKIYFLLHVVGLEGL